MAKIRDRERLYTDREIGTLIQRATEIQRNASESDVRGLSFTEIEHIATEIGIDPEHLRTAAVELASGPEERRKARFWGGPFVLEQERLVEGALTDDQWEQVVLGLRRMTGCAGTVSEIGRIREWTRTIKDMDYLIERTQVTLSEREDQTTINLQKHYRGGARMAYVLSVLVSGTVAGIFLDGGGLTDFMNAVILGGSGLGGLAAVRTSLVFYADRQRERLKVLTDWVHETISQPAAVASGPSATLETPEFIQEEISESLVRGQKVKV